MVVGKDESYLCILSKSALWNTLVYLTCAFKYFLLFFFAHCTLHTQQTCIIYFLVWALKLIAFCDCRSKVKYPDSTNLWVLWFKKQLSEVYYFSINVKISYFMRLSPSNLNYYAYTEKWNLSNEINYIT